MNMLFATFKMAHTIPRKNNKNNFQKSFQQSELYMNKHVKIRGLQLLWPMKHINVIGKFESFYSKINWQLKLQNYFFKIIITETSEL